MFKGGFTMENDKFESGKEDMVCICEIMRFKPMW